MDFNQEKKSKSSVKTRKAYLIKLMKFYLPIIGPSPTVDGGFTLAPRVVSDSNFDAAIQAIHATCIVYRKS